jgi:hypothetical protein
MSQSFISLMIGFPAQKSDPIYQCEASPKTSFNFTSLLTERKN